MFTESAEVYDLICSSFKDYPSEAKHIAELLHKIHPHCQTVLDVGCGTGEHAHLLAAYHGFEVDGLDLDPAFVRIASAKHPAGRFRQADMADFHLGRQYDAVLCLFSSIGYLRTSESVARALCCFREHLARDGIVIVEPWLTPEAMSPGHSDPRTVEAQGLRIVRVSHNEIDGRLSRIRFEYQIEGPEGIRHASEVHELGLFTIDEMLRLFEAAGLAADYDSRGLSDRGLYVAKVAADRP